MLLKNPLSKQHAITTPSDTECVEDLGNFSGAGDCQQNLKVFNDLDKNVDSSSAVVLDAHKNHAGKVRVSVKNLRYLNSYCE